MIFKDYYKILGLKNTQISNEEIRNAYKKQAKIYHPDKNVGNISAEERFKDINEAYRTLSNTKLKHKYDRKWNIYVGSKIKKQHREEYKKNTIINNFTNILFGNNEGNIIENDEINGKDVNTEISISLEDAYYGKNKTISIKNIYGEANTFDIKIPKGVKNHERIRVLGKGNEGKNGGKNGDLYIKINILPNNNFKLKNNDLITNINITPFQAVLGTKYTIKTIEDEEIEIQIPQGTNSGEKIKLLGKGYKNSDNEKGDLIANINIVTPNELSEEEINLYKQLDKLYKK